MRINYVWEGVANSFTAPLDTESDIENAANALAFMLSQGIEADVIAERFHHLHKIGTRLNVTEGVNGCSIILDSYTSDFSSLRPALDFMRRRRIPRQSSTLILSDLHHETSPTGNLYTEIAEIIRTAGISRFIGIGKVLSEHRELFPETHFFSNQPLRCSKISPHPIFRTR